MTMSHLEIRRSTAAETAAARALVRDAYRHYVARMGREPAPMCDDYEARKADGDLWVCRRAAELVGVLVLRDRPHFLLLDNVAVARDAQGQGIGRGLVVFAEAEARRRHYTEIQLYTHRTMVENQAFYRRLGWQEMEHREEMGYERVYFRKRLDQRV